MFFTIILFILIGIVLGIVTGLIPGLHPNTLVLTIPVIVSLNIASLPLLAMIVAMAVTNSIVDFIPSILLGAPDTGNELSVLPGHRLLMRGQGYHAIKLTVIGGLGAVFVCTLLLPLMILVIPSMYDAIKPIIHFLLIGVVILMVWMERTTNKRVIALLCFFLAGTIGILSSSLPIDKSLLLFPILSGLFGMSMLVTQIRQKTSIPKQRQKEEYVPMGILNRSILLGSLAGIVAGMLPAIGSSQMAVFASSDRNDKSFLTSVGAITTANIIISFLTIWLISRARSGVAIVVDQLMHIGFNELMFIVVIAIIATGAASIVTIKLAKKAIDIMKRFNYSLVNLFVLVMINILILLFTNFLGLFLAWLCCFLGLFAIMGGVRRSHLIGVLILPTILFYFGML